MIPRTLSASSLSVAEKCLRRWKAEYMDRIPTESGNTAAALGTTCHAALERFVELYMKTGEWDWDTLQMFYARAFSTTMGYDDTIPEYDDGLQMLNKWFSRTDLGDRTVISCEQKESFFVPTSAGKIRFNYIMDRLDKVGEDRYEIVDYKSQRLPLNFSELQNKIQAKVYALAVQIKYPEAKEIGVTFDLLRHVPVTVWFTKADNVKTWGYLKDLAESIVQTPESKAKATLNSDCRFCPVKTTCPAIKDNTEKGGTHGIDTPEKAVKKIYELQSALKVAEQMKKEMEDYVMKFAVELGLTEWETEDGKLSVSVGHGRGRRVILDQEKLINLLPPEIVAQHTKIGVTELDKILKSGVLDRATAAKARKLVDESPGNLGVSVKAK